MSKGGGAGVKRRGVWVHVRMASGSSANHRQGEGEAVANVKATMSQCCQHHQR